MVHPRSAFVYSMPIISLTFELNVKQKVIHQDNQSCSLDYPNENEIIVW